MPFLRLALCELVVVACCEIPYGLNRLWLLHLRDDPLPTSGREFQDLLDD